MESKVPQANSRVLLAALLCAAAAAGSFLPVSSAAAASSPPPSPLVFRTCLRSSNPRLCRALLQPSSNRSSSAAARDLAAVALTAARASVVRALDGINGARVRGAVAPQASYLVALCAVQYSICLRNTANALGWVATPAKDNTTVSFVSKLRRFPETCERLFHEAKVASPLEKVNRDAEETLIVVSEIITQLLP